MKAAWKVAIALLIMAPTASAGELVWIDDHGTTVEPASLLADAIRGTRFGFPDDDNGPGTLFCWRYGQGDGGGPDRNAPLVTDRPRFTQSSRTVGRRVAQVEFGYTFAMDDETGNRLRHHSAGEPLVRWGMAADWLELRLAVAPVSQRSHDGSAWRAVSGTEDLSLGAKIGLAPFQEGLPEMALILQSTVPTGSNEFTTGQTLPGFILVYTWEVNDDVSVAGSTRAHRVLDATEKAYVELAQSATVTLDLSEDVGMYTEWYTLLPNGADTAEVEHYINGGFTILLSHNVQFDIRAGYGLNRAADDFFAGGGLSVRFR